jgi:hypothetical protein
MSVRLSSWSNSSRTGRIFMKFDWVCFFENVTRKFNFNENLTRIKGTLHEDLYTLIIFRLVFLRTRKFSEKLNTYVSCPIIYFRKSCLFLRQCGEKKYCTAPRILWCMRIGCWIPKATNSHSEYVIRIAFPLQQWLQEQA